MTSVIAFAQDCPQRERSSIAMSDSPDHENLVRRKHLVTGAVSAPIDRIEGHLISLEPLRKSGAHTHDGGVLGYVLSGEIAFEIEGQQATDLHAGDAFYEPPGKRILHFDNVSETNEATFLAWYPLHGEMALVRFESTLFGRDASLEE